jgi:hypothetical protein
MVMLFQGCLQTQIEIAKPFKYKWMQIEESIDLIGQHYG